VLITSSAADPHADNEEVGPMTWAANQRKKEKNAICRELPLLLLRNIASHRLMNENAFGLFGFVLWLLGQSDLK